MHAARLASQAGPISEPSDRHSGPRQRLQMHAMRRASQLVLARKMATDTTRPFQLPRHANLTNLGEGRINLCAFSSLGITISRARHNHHGTLTNDRPHELARHLDRGRLSCSEKPRYLAAHEFRPSLDVEHLQEA